MTSNDSFNYATSNSEQELDLREQLLSFDSEDVEWKTIKELFEIRNGYTPSTKNSSFWTDGDIPWFRMEDIRKFGRVLSESTKYVTQEAIKGSGLFDAGSFIMATTATIGEHAFLTVDALANQQFTNMKVQEIFKERCNTRYLYYYLFKVGEWCKTHVRKGGFASVDMKGFKEIQIPVPSLSRQQEIVEVLDTFTDAISNLEEELTLREKQFEYYRESILSFENESVDWTPISELGQIIRGNGLQKKDFVQEGVGCIHYGQIYTKFGLATSYTLSFVDAKLADKLTKVDPGNLVIACTSENVDDLCKSVVWLGNTTIVTGGHACVLKHKENAKYIGYCFTSNSFQSQKKKFAYGTKVLDIKKDKLGEIKIPVPSLERQQEIVEILDTFEAMIANIKEEIALRTKQYEYYREKLLSFGK